MIDWSRIDTVLLDMDGTLLDLHYDNYFWNDFLPRHWAEINGFDPEEAGRELSLRIRNARGSLQWYCTDFWSEQLSLNIAQLKRKVADRIAYRPHTETFLAQLNASGRQVWLVTNAHRDSYSLKAEITGLHQYMHEIFISHDLLAAKEDQAFWHQLKQKKHFNPERTLLIDDNVAVLDAALEYGIGQILCLQQPDSKSPLRSDLPHPAILHFDEIMPIPPA